MKLIKHGHACVRLEKDGQVLVIDPGTMTGASALDGATDVLVTHEHPDHVDVAKLSAAPGLRVYTHAALASELDGLNAGLEVVVVAPGDRLQIAGFSVSVVGGEHAETFDGLPGCPNVGFVADTVYHPGDSYFVPQEQVETLLVPASGPWTKLGEALAFTRAVKPVRAFPIHESLASELGMQYFADWMAFKGETVYTRLGAGESAEV